MYFDLFFMAVKIENLCQLLSILDDDDDERVFTGERVGIRGRCCRLELPCL